jgi:hypothetical protein
MKTEPLEKEENRSEVPVEDSPETAKRKRIRIYDLCDPIDVAAIDANKAIKFEEFETPNKSLYC